MLKYQKLFTWKFSAISQGNAKSVVRTKTLSKGKYHVVVQNPKDFAEVVKKYLGKTDVIFISEEKIHHYVSVNKLIGRNC